MCHAVLILLAPCLHCNHPSRWCSVPDAASPRSVLRLKKKKKKKSFPVPALVPGGCEWAQFWWKSVAALFSKDPKNTPFNNGSNFNTSTSMIHTHFTRWLGIAEICEIFWICCYAKNSVMWYVMKYQTFQTSSVFLPLLVHLFTNGSVVDHGVVSFYISECYWALLFNSCLHCMYIFKIKMRCIYESFKSSYGTVSPTTWWELKYFCSIKFLKNMKIKSVERCGWSVLSVAEIRLDATLQGLTRAWRLKLRLWILELITWSHF